MKSHFWKIFIVWYLLLLAVFYLYHSQAAKVRINDFKIKKILFREYQEKHQLPAYLALSKAEFLASRYAKNRDELLQSGEIRGYALNQIDEIIKIKEREQFFLSSLMWFGLLVLFIGFLFYLKQIVTLFFSLATKKNFKKELWRLLLSGFLIFIAFSASKLTAHQFRENVSSEYDFDEAMQVALKVDEYYQIVFDHLIKVSNSFFVWQRTSDLDAQKTMLQEIRDGLRDMENALQNFKNMKSVFIDFDGNDLVTQTEQIAAVILNLLSDMDENIKKNISLSELENTLKNTLNQYQYFLENLIARHEVAFSDQAKFLFLPEAINEYEKITRTNFDQNPQYLYFGYFLYQAMGYLIR